MSYVVAYGGERLDRIAKKLLQSEQLGTVEALLDVNPGLASAAVDGTVPAGTVIRLPETFAPRVTVKRVLAWE